MSSLMIRTGLGGISPVAGWLRAPIIVVLLALPLTGLHAQENDAGYADLVARVMPSVVSISVRKAVPTNDSRGGQDSGAAQRTRDSGVHIFGSGFIIDPAGYILTNRHVVVDSYSITVALPDGSRLVAHVVGHPPSTDIALLKVDTDHPLPAITWGDSGKVRVGDRVFAVGNPLDLGETVTSGIVSALNRNTQETPYDNFIQTDAAINHGNSGGPLFNTRGEVIGIDTSIYSPTASGGSIGLGFALPSADARFAAAQLREFGRVRPGWIGARLQQVTPDLANAFGLPTTQGAIVAGAEPSGPADSAGLQSGDVIGTFNGQNPADVRALMRMIAEAPLDRPATLTVHRQNAEVTLNVTIREYPPAKMLADFPFRQSTPPPMASGDTGLNLSPMTAADRVRLKLPLGQPGVAIVSVPAQSAADRAGLRAGDAILRVQGRPATAPDVIRQELQSTQATHRENLALLAVGPGGKRWVALPIKAPQ